MIYSGTSLTKSSEIKDTIEKTFVMRTITLVPTNIIKTFLISERGKALYCSKMWPKIPGPKVFVIEVTLHYPNSYVLKVFRLVNLFGSDKNLILLFLNPFNPHIFKITKLRIFAYARRLQGERW